MYSNTPAAAAADSLPPSSNTGVRSDYPPTPLSSSPLPEDLGAAPTKFDYYAASIKSLDLSEELGPLMSMLADFFPGCAWSDMGKGMLGYLRAQQLRNRDDEVQVILLYGGTNPGVHVRASGDASIPLAHVLRKNFPDRHIVSRLDAATDYDFPGAWDAIVSRAISLAKELRLSTSTSGDWLEGQRGRTLYVGARSSTVFIRIYEKGIQMGQARDWVRVEFEIKPDNQTTKAKAASILPVDCWGVSPFTRALADALGAAGVQPVRLNTIWKPTNLESRSMSLFKQYAPTVLELLQHFNGDYEALGRFMAVEAQVCRNTGDAYRVDFERPFKKAPAYDVQDIEAEETLPF